MANGENTETDWEFVAKSPFRDIDELIDALRNEILFLQDCKASATQRKQQAAFPSVAEWFETWEDRLEELKIQAETWLVSLEGGYAPAVLNEARIERDVLMGLLGLAKITRLGLKDAPDDTPGSIAKETLGSYIKDFQRTNASMRKVIRVLRP
ncbi:MAG: hypothetical protein GY791_11070 [Alphaproteobacteria bacterium]|nr:hypothetical protein [Alphaproteobacteria bacterium]